MIDFVAKYVSLVKSGLPIEKVPEKYRKAVSDAIEDNE